MSFRVDIADEAAALDALNAVLAWAQRQPDSEHGGKATGITYQRGRVIATWTHDGTVGMSSYPTPKVAAEKAGEMEAAYRNWVAIRDARVAIISRRPPDDPTEGGR
jgi:hypothetical protein